MSDWLDDIDGVKDLIDATGEVEITLPRYAKLAIRGAGVRLETDPVAEANRLIVEGSPGFTGAVQTGNHQAAYGEYVRMGAGGGIVTLPPAAAKKNGQVGVLNVAGSNVSVAPSAGNTLQGVTTPIAINATGAGLVLMSDGASGWWIVARTT
jgi:hypothetical protein